MKSFSSNYYSFPVIFRLICGLGTGILNGNARYVRKSLQNPGFRRTSRQKSSQTHDPKLQFAQILGHNNWKCTVNLGLPYFAIHIRINMPEFSGWGGIMYVENDLLTDASRVYSEAEKDERRVYI